MGRAALVLGCVAKDWACWISSEAPDDESEPSTLWRGCGTRTAPCLLVSRARRHLMMPRRQGRLLRLVRLSLGHLASRTPREATGYWRDYWATPTLLLELLL